MTLITDMTDGGLKKAYDFAAENGLTENLNDKLAHLERHCKNGHEIRLFNDFSPLSFEWALIEKESGRCSLNGGLIFHGIHDDGGSGSAPTFSVNLSPVNGWAIHT